MKPMNHRASAAVLTVLAGATFCFWGCASRKPITAEDAAYPEPKVDAQGLFQENCVTCHGANGRAHTFHGRVVGAQNLTDSNWQSETSDAQIINAIKTGPSVMPAFEKKLSEAEIDALAAYVRHFKPANKP
jgi:cbb3-type cytochrome c oxidase subunit III